MKTIVVTGASAGIGREVARGAAARGARVILVCRDRARGERAQAELRRTVSTGTLELVVADLASLLDVRRLAEILTRRLERLDVLVHNAGVVTPTRETTEDGFERTFATNHLGPFLCTHLLLPLLRRSAPSRVVVVASQVEARGDIHFDDLQQERSFEPLRAYDQSKLANVMFTQALARRLEGTGVSVNCLHPGVLATNLLCDYLGRPRVASLAHRFTHPGPARGAEHVLRLAFDPALEGVTGRYFHEGRERPSSPRSRDVELQERLFRRTAELVGLELAAEPSAERER
jgi:NAD(P)-dependent dehydrogenase (short-subunit alcohol dehydrogenase family)